MFLKLCNFLFMLAHCFCFCLCIISFALVRSYTLLWKLHKCTRIGRRLLFLTSLLTVETLNVFGFRSWSFIIHCVSLIHLSYTLWLLTLCFVVRCICETRVGEVNFPCRLSTTIMFTHLFICYYSFIPLV
jgi:hypothetical protein